MGVEGIWCEAVTKYVDRLQKAQSPGPRALANQNRLVKSRDTKLRIYYSLARQAQLGITLGGKNGGFDQGHDINDHKWYDACFLVVSATTPPPPPSEKNVITYF